MLTLLSTKGIKIIIFKKKKSRTNKNTKKHNTHTHTFKFDKFDHTLTQVNDYTRRKKHLHTNLSVYTESSKVTKS